MAAVDKLTRQMLAGEQMSSVAALARDAPEWARAFVDAADGAALRQQIAARDGVPAGLLRLTCGDRELSDAAVLPDGCVRVLLRLEGGKGGFGAMLRTSGARGIKTIDRRGIDAVVAAIIQQDGHL